MIKKYFTSNYKKDKDSNISKISDIISGEIKALRSVFADLESLNDIENAEGKVLDLEGLNINQGRGKTNDEVYRMLIRSKKARSLSDGTLDNLLNVLALSLQVDKSEMSFEEGDHDTFPSIKVLQVPVDVLVKAGMSTKQLGDLIEAVISAGVKLEEIEFIGGFEYGNDELLENSDTGYSNINMEVGGQLGDLYRPGQEDDLPI